MEKNKLEDIISRYLNAVKEVQEQKNISREESLKRLLEPIVNLHNDSSLPDSGHKFVREDYINLNEEIDCSSLENTSEEWEILPNWKLREFGDLNTSDEIISVNYAKFLPEKKTITSSIEDSIVRTSVHKLYKDWLPHLNQMRIQSRNLLDQILVCYTIKRAQNGDEQASDKLISLYEGRAESKETYLNVLKMMTWREENKAGSNNAYINVLKQVTWTWPEKKRDSEKKKEEKDKVYNYDVDDFRQLAKIYLVFIIRGFSPKSILDSLIKNQKSEFMPILRGVGDVFLYYFGEYIPEIIDKSTTYLNDVRESLKDYTNPLKLVKMLESSVNLLECFSIQDNTTAINNMREVLKNNAHLLPIELVMDVWLSMLPIIMKIPDVVAPYFATLLDPYTPINSDIAIKKSDNKNVARILSACYRHQKMGLRQNLTTWLFGGDGKSYALGKLYQSLRDYYSLKADDGAMVPFYKSPKTEASQEDETYRHHVNRRISEDVERIDQIASTTLDLQMLVKKANISNNDYELLLDNYGGSTLEELAEKYNLTKDQVRYKLKSIMKTLHKTIS